MEQGGDVEEEISSSAKVRVATRRAASSSLATGIGGGLESETLGFVASQTNEQNWEQKRGDAKLSFTNGGCLPRPDGNVSSPDAWRRPLFLAAAGHHTTAPAAQVPPDQPNPGTRR